MGKKRLDSKHKMKTDCENKKTINQIHPTNRFQLSIQLKFFCSFFSCCVFFCFSGIAIFIFFAKPL